MLMNQWNHALVVLLIVFLGSLLVAKLTDKPRIPDVAAFLVLGILMGPSVLGWIQIPTNSSVNQFVLNVGAALILFDGGRAVSFSILKQVWFSITMLATVGVLVSAVVVGLAAHLWWGTPWIFSLLLAAVIASTDPATLLPVFKRVPILPRLQQTVESESAFNDATASVLVFTLLSMLQAHHSSMVWYSPIWQFISSACIGLAVGLVFGVLALWLVSERGWGLFHDYGSIVFLVLALGSFEAADLLHGSGFMATFTAGVITGNGSSFRLTMSKHTETNVHHFGNAITVLFRMMIFVFLGTQVNFHMVASDVGGALLIVGVLMLIARPLSVLVSVLPDRRVRWSWRELLFMFWVRETGVIPAALAGMIAASSMPGSARISAVTFVAILLTIVVQASTTPFVAKWLRVDIPGEEEDV